MGMHRYPAEIEMIGVALIDEGIWCELAR
jgi:hypothetical protein